eukprot:27543-Chlamydomonas_euryale.AAC.12
MTPGSFRPTSVSAAATSSEVRAQMPTTSSSVLTLVVRPDTAWERARMCEHACTCVCTCMFWEHALGLGSGSRSRGSGTLKPQSTIPTAEVQEG